MLYNFLPLVYVIFFIFCVVTAMLFFSYLRFVFFNKKYTLYEMFTVSAEQKEPAPISVSTPNAVADVYVTSEEEKWELVRQMLVSPNGDKASAVSICDIASEEWQQLTAVLFNLDPNTSIDSSSVECNKDLEQALWSIAYKLGFIHGSSPTGASTVLALTDVDLAIFAYRFVESCLYTGSLKQEIAVDANLNTLIETALQTHLPPARSFTADDDNSGGANAVVGCLTDPDAFDYLKRVEAVGNLPMLLQDQPELKPIADLILSRTDSGTFRPAGAVSTVLNSVSQKVNPADSTGVNFWAGLSNYNCHLEHSRALTTLCQITRQLRKLGSDYEVSFPMGMSDVHALMPSLLVQVEARMNLPYYYSHLYGYGTNPMYAGTNCFYTNILFSDVPKAPSASGFSFIFSSGHQLRSTALFTDYFTLFYFVVSAFILCYRVRKYNQVLGVFLFCHLT